MPASLFFRNKLNIEAQSHNTRRGWGVGANCTVTLTPTAEAGHEPNVVRVETTVAGVPSLFSGGTGQDQCLVTPGEVLTFQREVKALQTARAWTGKLEFFDAANVSLSSEQRGMGSSVVGSWATLSWSSTITVPAGAHHVTTSMFSAAQAVGEQTDMDNAWLRNPPVPATATASPTGTVPAGSLVTLIGAPSGGTWAEVTATGATLSAPVTSSTDTRVTFTAANPSTTGTLSRTFRYTAGDVYADVTVTAAASASSAGGLFTETFPGATGAAWPVGWRLGVAGWAGGASAATQEGGRGRLTVPNAAGYPGTAEHRDVGTPDLEVTWFCSGTFDPSTPDGARHYREVYARLDPAANAATGLPEAYFVTVRPSTSAPATEPWVVLLQRRKNGVAVELDREQGLLPPATRDMRGRWRLNGRLLQARVWPASSPEPSAWTVEYEDLAADARLTGTGFALVLFGGNTGTGTTPIRADWDDVAAVAALAPPVVTLTGPSVTLWPDPIPLVAAGSGYDSLTWRVAYRPPGSALSIPGGASSVNPVPDAAGLYVFEVVATNGQTTTVASLEVEVYAQLWQYGSDVTKKYPVAIGRYP